MNATTIPEKPFEKIALSMSGGGYRAASFHLGSMSYLDHLQYNDESLLNHVSMISTVSGGTITGIVYAMGRQQGKDFKHIFRFLTDRLSQIDLIKEGLSKLNAGSAWQNDTKQKNLINAFSELYDKYFTEGATLGLLNPQDNLEHVVFNSTEFANAVNFRFRNAGAGYCGNHYMQYRTPVSNEIKLSDIMAASSCFPGGFEPLLWPHDFVHAAAPSLQALANNMAPVGIMDGGIYDNQGIDSIINYKKDSGKPPYFDLVIISDVASPDMVPFKKFTENKRPGALSHLTVGDLVSRVRSIDLLSTGVIIFLAVIFFSLTAWLNPAHPFLAGIMLGFGLAVVITLIAKLWVISSLTVLYYEKKKWFTETYKGFYLDKLAALDIRNISLRRVQPLLMDRLNSLLTLLMDAFLKIVRRLNYNRLYENDQYKYRRISNLIKELATGDPATKQSRWMKAASGTEQQPESGNASIPENQETFSGSAISAVAKRASAFGTTLWFTDEDHDVNLLDDLIATGQFTMCYNLAEYLEKLITDENSGFASLPEATRKALKKTHDSCLDDWRKFSKDPYHLIRYIRKDPEIPAVDPLPAK